MRLTKEEELLNYLILHSFDYPDEIGLLSGQMGHIIVITRYARQKNHIVLDEVADCLFENVVSRVSSMRDFGFASGISGICWGVEYLTQHGIITDTGQNICGELDNLIARIDVESFRDYSLETGLLGLWHYVWSRIQGNMQASLELPFADSYLKGWINVLGRRPDKFPKKALINLRSALDGKLNHVPLAIRPFIKTNIGPDLRNLSLATGLAGYVESEYLS